MLLVVKINVMKRTPDKCALHSLAVGHRRSYNKATQWASCVTHFLFIMAEDMMKSLSEQ